jgi:hypothetical protein
MGFQSLFHLGQKHNFYSFFHEYAAILSVRSAFVRLCRLMGIYPSVEDPIYGAAGRFILSPGAVQLYFTNTN